MILQNSHMQYNISYAVGLIVVPCKNEYVISTMQIVTDISCHIKLQNDYLLSIMNALKCRTLATKMLS